MKKVPNDQGRSARNRLVLRWALFACAIGSTSYYCQRTHAQTWNAPTDGSWHDGANWSGGTIPNSTTANAVINATNPPVVPPDDPLPPYTVTLDAATAIGSLSLDSPDAIVSHTGGTLTVANGIDLIKGKYVIDVGIISGGTLRTNESLYLARSGFSGTGGTLSGVHVLDDLTIRAEDFRSQLTLANNTILDKGIVFKGFESMTIILDQNLNILSGNAIDHQAHGEIDILKNRTLTIDQGATANSGLTVYGLGTLINNGIISSFDGPTTLSISITNDNVINNGTIQAGNQAIIEIRSNSFHNTITGQVIASDNGHISIGKFSNDAWQNEGVIRVADATASIELGGTFSNADFNNVENANGGKIEISGTWNNQNGHTFNANQGDIEFNEGTIIGGNLTAGINGEFMHFNSGTLDGVQFNHDLSPASGGYAELKNNAVVIGNIQVNSATLYMNQDFATTVGRSFDLIGTPDIYSNLEVGPQHTFTVSEGTTISVTDSNINGGTYDGFDPVGYEGSAKLVNEGTINLQGGVGSGFLDIQNSGHINLNDSGSVFYHTSIFDNQSTGSVQIADGASMTVGQLLNSGSITLLGQGASFSMADVSSGSLNGINNQSGGTLAVTRTWHNQDDYTFNSTTGSIHLYGEVVGGILTPGSNGEFLIVHEGQLNGVTVNSSIDIASGNYLILSGNTQINGNINIDSALILNQDFTAADNQMIRLGGGESRIFVNDPFTLSFAAGSTLAGNGTIYTSNGTVHIDGTVSPGFSPGHIEFQSDVVLGATSKLEIELASLNSFDTLAVKGDAVLGGDLHVSLLNGFALQSNQSFLFMNIDGTSSGLFKGLAENGIVGNYNGTDLFISYLGGDGNDVRLFTIAAVPEPASFGLLAACGAIYVGWRRKSKKTKASGTEPSVA